MHCDGVHRGQDRFGHACSSPLAWSRSRWFRRPFVSWSEQRTERASDEDSVSLPHAPSLRLIAVQSRQRRDAVRAHFAGRELRPPSKRQVTGRTYVFSNYQQDGLKCIMNAPARDPGSHCHGPITTHPISNQERTCSLCCVSCPVRRLHLRVALVAVPL